MPIFEYICHSCGHRFERIVFGMDDPACPSCNGNRTEKQISAFAVGATGNPSAGSSSGSCGTCGDPRGPGACSMS